ncbi:glutamate ABC transporter substrate-binding protein [Homoserinibacter sp. YIM 151385]|uniref:glutamate ABC transporter substrate-binding protein n=1 Tax=Homoserinibacter sp. YIM 151385 TaxID=2985506 RepID=UPI0022F0B535|nr:glutamate ABC transporter substrate-binding protein [Homoserinibacter sp. YIM 151385]WBU38875.1 glutamate ABC transporter substrate-binding protein [Homoserinibacter sp. YIM 151385]
MRLKKSLAVGAIAAIGILGLAACTDSGAGEAGPETEVEQQEFEAGTTMAELQEAGTITIGTKFDQPLFGQVDADGKPQGFDVEIGKIIAAKLGIESDKIKWVEAQSANREPYIEAGQVDIVIATYTINDERKEIISFAGPYYEAGQDFLVLAGNPDGIESVDDLEGEPVCTVQGSTSEANIAEVTDDITALGGYAECLEPLRQGSVKALTTDNVILAGLAAQNEGEFEVVGNPFTEEPYGIGLAKDDTDFRDFINDVLEDSYEDGSWVDAWEKTAGTVLDTPEPPAVDRY